MQTIDTIMTTYWRLKSNLDRRVWFVQDGSTGTLRFWVDQWNTVGKFVQTDTTLDANKWYHICGTFDNTNGGLLYEMAKHKIQVRLSLLQV